MENLDPEIGKTILAAGVQTNYHDVGDGPPVFLIHGSGPGVSAYANWRMTLPALSKRRRVIAPDMVGFGFTERLAEVKYGMDIWVRHIVGVMDALKIKAADVVGNSFGGALALALAIRHPERVGRLVLMGSVGTRFLITPALDATWGYEPSVDAMERLIKQFAFDQKLVASDLVRRRYQASIRPGVQESYAAMFPAPRQRWVTAMASPEEKVCALQHETLIVHGREDRVIPLSSAYKLLEMIPRANLHVFGRCGHWTQIEHAEAFNELLDRFLTN